MLEKPTIEQPLVQGSVIDNFEEQYIVKGEGEPLDSLDQFMEGSFLQEPKQKNMHTELPEHITLHLGEKIKSDLSEFDIVDVKIPGVGNGYIVDGIFLLSTECQEPKDNACCLSRIRIDMDMTNKKILWNGSNISKLTESPTGRYDYNNYIVSKDGWEIEIQDRFVCGNCYPGIPPELECFKQKGWKVIRNSNTDITFKEQDHEKEIADSVDEINSIPIDFSKWED